MSSPIKGIIDGIKGLSGALASIWNLITGLWGKLVSIYTNTLALFDNINMLIGNVQTVVTDIRTFDINPKWNTRVISAPRVVEHIQELYAVPERILTDVRDLVQLLKEKIQPAEIKPSTIEEAESLPVKIAKVGEKILGFATLIIDALVAIESAVADLNDIVDAIKTSLEDLRGLDALFLPQGNPKKSVDAHYRKRIRS
jgi:hypothetical protein